MHLPLDFAILFIKDAETLVAFIETSTAEKNRPKNYHKMGELAILDLYITLRDFIKMKKHYEDRLKYLGGD